jgi:hypothetical protein
MITVVMPQWQRWVYRFGPWLCLLVFLLIAGLVARPVLANPEIRRQGLVPLTVFFSCATIWAMATMTWFLRRLIAECSYDGGMLRFTTVGRAEAEIRPVLDLSDIDEWREYRGRFGGPGLMGYRLTFRDRQKLYLDLGIANVRDLVARLQADRWPDRSPD